jgi:hypothetical protein
MKNRIPWTACIFTFLLVSCVSKSEYEALERQNKQLKQELEALRLEQRQREEQERLALIKHRSDEEALKLIKDFYEFYNADMIYRKPKVRRLSSNQFVISLEECVKKGGFSDQDFFWHSRVLNLTINSDDTYKMD